MKSAVGITLELVIACGCSDETVISLEGWWFSLKDSKGSADSEACGVAISLWILCSVANLACTTLESVVCESEGESG